MASLQSFQVASLPFVFVSIRVASVALFLLKGYQERTRAIDLRKQGFVGRICL